MSGPQAWSEQLAREGRVVFRLSFWRTLKILLLVFGVWFLTLGIFVAAVVDGAIGMAVLGGIGLIVWTPLAVVMHLDQLTSGSPRLYVDTLGVHMARWRRLDIPWGQIRGVTHFAPNRLLSNPVVHTTPEFFVGYQQSLGSVLRVVTGIGGALAGAGFYATPCLKGDTWEIADWLDAQVAERTGRDESRA
ncbi:hypothetical protein [Nocardioides cavernaquae]|uniref:PH domain-containing protein n=1 Tax=Nocardioides cavernaquae TaxID=2321396 RepID=A0A3A5H9G8_9ACTN|nr:hypothetical protein [Nocardioides cavernaquae]RJS46498.1 hypothetical protein D4739_09925 [Nocardioides cavernaquae]